MGNGSLVNTTQKWPQKGRGRMTDRPRRDSLELRVKVVQIFKELDNEKRCSFLGTIIPTISIGFLERCLSMKSSKKAT